MILWFTILILNFKYADDLALVGLLQKKWYKWVGWIYEYVEELLGWCKNSALILNINKIRN